LDKFSHLLGGANMEWRWEENISCIQFIDGSIKCYHCPENEKYNGDCDVCSYFRGVKYEENYNINDLKGCCALLLKD
jgi:hypothetical protein